MQLKITYFMRCEYCTKITEYVARDKNVNEGLTDKDIRRMVYLRLEMPKEIAYCRHCGLETLQTRVAWEGTI